MDAILEISRSECAPLVRSKAGPSRIPDGSSSTTEQQLISIDQDIHEIDAKIKLLNSTRTELFRQKRELEQKQLQQRQQRIGPNMTLDRKGKGAVIDYSGEFPWTPDLLKRMKQVFNIDNFRLCQQGYVYFLAQFYVPALNLGRRVCNANMDGRDIVCVMPTGTN